MIPKNILDLLPKAVALAVAGADETKEAEEVRLRLGGRSSLVLCGGEEVDIGADVSENDLNDTLLRVCGGSLHSYGDSIAGGWIPLPGGCRVGVCGKALASPDGAGIESVCKISSMNFRIPRSISGIGGSICDYYAAKGYRSGILICSLPGAGKTTLLRDIAATLSKPPHNRRVAVIDSRSELWRSDMFRDSFADRYDRYPKGAGIELATRTMSPHVIVCDELSSDDLPSVLAAQNSGVPLIASAHAAGPHEAMRRRGLRRLFADNVFRCIVTLERTGSRLSLELTETDGCRLCRKYLMEQKGTVIM